MAGQRVAPGAWVSVRIATGATSAQMAIGSEEPSAAYIENLAGRRDIETFAKRRCPRLRPGSYQVRVYTPDGVSETSIQII